MYKAPVICPKGSRVVITQGYKPDIHDSVDFIIWNDSYSHDLNKELTFGAQLVSPLKKAVCIFAQWDAKTIGSQGQEAPSGGWVDIQGYHDEKNDIIFHFQHNCANNVKVGDSISEGQIVGFMGNAGLCSPIPTPDYPFDGTHTHLTVYLKGRGQYANAIRVNPFDYVDFSKWYEGSDSSIDIDNKVRIWGLNKKGFTTNLQKMIYLLQRWWNGK